MTEGVVEGILRILPDPQRVTLIKNAVDLAVFRPGQPELRAEVRARYGLGDRFVAVHIGNMSLTYDFDVLLAAAAALPEIIFLFAGGGSQAESVQARAQERQLANVIFVGVLPHEQMPGLWAAADACLIALGDHSVAGGTRPAKLYEALAAGTPVVAAIRGEGAALLEESGAGTVVPIGDSAAMVAALRGLAQSPERRVALSAAGRAYAERALSPEPVKRAYAEILARAARRS